MEGSQISLTPLSVMFLRATEAASGSFSTATTDEAPSFAAVIARTPEPVPTSMTPEDSL